MNIVKTAKCPTLSGKSTLTYSFGTDEAGAYVSVQANSGGGFFSREWVAVKDILGALEKKPDAITSVVLYPLFRGKSVNTPAFLLAVLKHERLLTTAPGKQRVHQLGDAEAFLARIGKPGARKSPAAKKAVARKKTVARQQAAVKKRTSVKKKAIARKKTPVSKR